MGLTRPITRELTQILPRQLWRGLGLGKVEQILADARVALNIHPEQQVGGAYLVQKTPTLAGVVQDETPTRKDRTRLSCRASDFAVNQYFNGAVDIAGWTEFSISCWIRHGEVAADMYAMGSYGTTGANQAFVLGVLGTNDKPRFRLWDNSGTTDAEIEFPANSTNDNYWHLLTATYDFATETAKGYIDGRDVTAASTVIAGTNGSINTTQDANDFTVGTLLQNPTNYDWNGQLQQPLIYQGIWSAAQVRDLYLQQVDDIPITYGWFLDSDTASGLTSSSPALAPTNSPDLFESDEIGGGDWLNEKGYNLSGVDPIPKRWDEELDSLGNAADNSESFGVARRNGQLVGSSNCISLDGVNQYGTLPSEVSTVLSEANSFTVSMDFVCDDISSDTRQTLITNGADTLDRFTVQILSNGSIRASVYDGVFYSVSSANNLIANGEVNNFVCSWNGSEIKLWLNDVEIDDGTDDSSTIAGGGVFIGQSAGKQWDGQLWNLKIYNSSITAISDLDSLTTTHQYPMAEGSGSVSYDVVNGKNCTWVNSPDWGNQSNYFWNENQGCSLYEHATSPDILVPFGSDGLALTITPPSGYTKTSDNPAGPWLYEGLGDTYVNFDVVENANQWLEQRWQESEFNNTTSKIAIPALMTGATSFEIEAVVKSGDVNAYRVIYGIDSAQAKLLFRLTDTGTVNVFLNNGSVSLTGGTVIDDDEWHTVKAVYDGVDVRIFVDGVLDVTPFAFTDPIITYTHDDFIGQWNGNQSFDGEIKNLTATKDGVQVLDVPLLGTSLDLSQVNHGTDTDVVYNRLTDVSYQAGDTVEQPFSVNDDTSGRVSELIQFTFPVTTLSNTPTISQTVFEDGNTITEDSILISES